MGGYLGIEKKGATCQKARALNTFQPFLSVVRTSLGYQDSWMPDDTPELVLTLVLLPNLTFLLENLQRKRVSPTC